MKKNWRYLAVLLFMAVAAIGFLPVQTSSTIFINAPVNEVAGRFNHFDHWKSWYPHMSEIHSVIPRGPLAVDVGTVINGHSSQLRLSATPAGNGSATGLHLEKRQNRFHWLFNAGNGKDILYSLKTFIENDSLRYGFSIRLMPVADTVILTTRRTATMEKKNEVIDTLRRLLEAFILEQHIASNGDRYFVSMVKNEDGHAEVAVGIPVQSTGKDDASFQFLRLPSNGRLLAGTYNGKYSDIAQLYAAMDRYVIDKKLKKVAQPIEEYQLTDTVLSGAANVRMTLYYPVY